METNETSPETIANDNLSKMQDTPEQKPAKREFSKRTKSLLIVLLWLAILSPMIVLISMLMIANDDNMPTFEELENPKSNLASVIYSGDEVILGNYFRENRTNVSYHQLSPYLVNALIATEDERFREHSGVDLRATGRVIKGVVSNSTSQGGGSTLSQQLAKMLFPRKKLSKWELVQRKFKEWIIASKLERQYSKDEILTMYLNKFDFLNNAVGIYSASRVYFNTTPDSLQLHEAAMLVGMAKNPSLFNPLRKPDTVKHRRMVVLKQMWKNGYIDSLTYYKTKQMPLGLRYSRVDHQTGLAPYFRETLRGELKNLLNEKDGKGDYIRAKSDGTPYDIYIDGLKIYTTIDTRMQKYAEWAVQEHLKAELQDQFFENNAKWRNPPFSNDLSEGQIDTIMQQAKRRSQYYKMLSGRVCANCERPATYLSIKEKDGKKYHTCSYCEEQTPVRTKAELDEIFNTPHPTKVFDWHSANFEKDTVMSSMDSIRYTKSFLRAGLMSMDPKTGFIKAWVGGPEYHHFKYDMVKYGKRQVGSTFKPFVYATALQNKIIEPCEEFANIEYCIDIPYNKYRSKQWCPKNSGGKIDGTPTPLNYALAASMNNITAGVMKELDQGSTPANPNQGPKKVLEFIGRLGIDTAGLLPVPSMALGVFDLSIYEMVGAMSAYVNEGVYIKPIFITRIEDKHGNVLYDVVPEVKQAIEPDVAYTVLSMMKGVTSGVRHPYKKATAGTAIRIRGSKKNRPYAGIKYPIAGKTGTTQNQSDGWFMGLTPDLVTGVWVGGEDRAVRFRSLRLGMGTNMALPIWGYYMNKVYEDSTINISTGDFKKPSGMMNIQIDCNAYRQNSDFDILNPEGTIQGAEEEYYDDFQ